MESSTAALDLLGQFSAVPLDLIVDAPGQPREELPEVTSLAANICAYGLLQPVALRRCGPKYEVVAGHRRVAAYRSLRCQYPSDPGWRSIPALVTRVDDETAALSVVSAQVHVATWTAAEEYQVLDRLRGMGMNLSQISEMLHRDISWTSKRLRVLEDDVLGPSVQSGHVPVATAEEILPIRQPEQRQILVERAAREHWSQSQTRRHVRAVQAPRTSRLQQVARELAQLLNDTDPAALPVDDQIALSELHQRLDQVLRARGVAA